MGDRVLCDEHVAPRTVEYLLNDGHDAVHVRDALDLGVDDSTVADLARRGEYLLLTNDADFLDEEHYPDVALLYYPNNRTEAYELASRVARLSSIVSDQDELPRIVFLTEDHP